MNSKICPKCSTILHPITDSEIQSQSGGSSIKIALEMLNTPNTVTLDQIDFIDLEKIIDTPEYKELSTSSQELIFNHIQNLLPSQQKLLSKIINNFKEQSLRDHRVFLICPMGDFIQQMPKGLVLKDRYRGSQVDKTFVQNKYSVHNSTLPVTRDHKCLNGKDCKALKSGQPREFVFFRRPSGRVMHSCIACNS